jgi:hypothetical protein
MGPRYGSGIVNLQPAWLRLIDTEAVGATVFEECNGASAKIWGLGVAVFVCDAFIQEMKTAPLFWFGAELAKRVMNGHSPALSDREVREANSAAGLNLVVWEGLPRAEFMNRPDAFHLMVNSFLELYRGFRLKEMITSQVESVQRAEWAVDAGGFFWDPQRGLYVKTLTGTIEDFIRTPHVIGITREMELSRPGSWVGCLFDYQPPRFVFSPSEQRLLRAALTGESGTDRELACALSLSLAAIKKAWLSIYRRVADLHPELIPDGGRAESGASERGKEKKRHLLAYLREHPEELRPIAPKLLRQRPPT